MTAPSSTTSPASRLDEISVSSGDPAAICGAQGRLTIPEVGSGLGVSMYDPVAQVAGLAHLELPGTNAAADAAGTTDGRFVEQGLALLLARVLALGGRSDRLRIIIAGGAFRPATGSQFFSLGERNITAARKWFWMAKLLIAGQDLGGSSLRSMSITLCDGKTAIVRPGKTLRI